MFDVPSHVYLTGTVSEMTMLQLETAHRSCTLNLLICTSVPKFTTVEGMAPLGGAAQHPQGPGYVQLRFPNSSTLYKYQAILPQQLDLSQNADRASDIIFRCSHRRGNEYSKAVPSPKKVAVDRPCLDPETV